jgi:hypothetical protein
MTAVTGANLRSGEAYWELSGPVCLSRLASCRACRQTIYKGQSAMVRDGRKLRFMYHTSCFTGDADPRTQENSSFSEAKEYHEKTAPNKACVDPDGRPLGREVFKPTAPSVLGKGKWSVQSRGYKSGV